MRDGTITPTIDKFYSNNKRDTKTHNSTLFTKKNTKTSRKSKKSLVKRSKTRTNTKLDGWVFSLAGVHGVGKTTVYEFLERKLSNNPHFQFFPERLRSIPPVPFGSKNKQTAFRAELHYQQQMIQRNGLIAQFVRNHREHIAIVDRSPLSTLIYAKALGLPKIDYELIYDTYTSVSWLKEYVIYLHAEPKTVMNRIYRRGSLDLQRQKWNEEDFQYLLRVLNKYNEVFEEFKLEEKRKIIKINTENLTPSETADQVLEIIQNKSGIQLKSSYQTVRNQKKITSWIS